MSYEILTGDCIEQMRELDEATVDAVVCDPPYGIGFMGHEWDQPGREGRKFGKVTEHGRGHHKASVSPSMVAGEYDRSPSANRAFQEWCETWAHEAFRILKPGGHLLASCGTRTYHRMAAGVEDAGFEIRDSLIWIYGSGFPKSLDVSKAIDKAAGAEGELLGTDRRMNEPTGVDNAGRGAEARTEVVRELRAPATPEAEQWQGWGTALKPAHEPIVLARKPLTGTVAANVLEHGTGALNVDGCRIGNDSTQRVRTPDDFGLVNDDGWEPTAGVNGSESGRWPANITLSPEAAEELDRQSGERPSPAPYTRSAAAGNNVYGEGMGNKPAGAEQDGYGDIGGASRFFYTAKASRAERNAGLDGFEERRPDRDTGHTDGRQWDIPGSHATPRANVHPTVKPIDLMRWLVRLVTPPGGTILDPFLGSGTTGCAAALEGFDFVGIEREAEYREIAEARLAWWSKVPSGTDTEVALGLDRREREARGAGQTSLLEDAA